MAPVMGRDFAPSDDARAPRVVIVNRTLARRLWPGQSPLGKRLRLAGRDEPLREVVGVVPDTKVHALTEGPRGFLFFPERQQQNFGGDLTLVVRTTGAGAAMLPPVRAILRGMDANLPVYRQRSLEDQVRLGLDKERAASALLGSFGALALVLAALGLYGVMAYAVTQRTREMGIRMALGAARRDVLRLIVVEGVRLASVGIVVGLVLSAALTRVIGRFLYGVTPTDAVTFAAVAMLLAGVAALASLVPARRAVRVDPMVALRAE
jgi:predicted permease